MQVPRKARATERSRNCGLVSRNQTFSFIESFEYSRQVETVSTFATMRGAGPWAECKNQISKIKMTDKNAKIILLFRSE